MKQTPGNDSRHGNRRTHPVLAISMGDMNGVGPEVILKMLPELQRSNAGDNAGILLFASREAMLYYARSVMPDMAPPGFLTDPPPTGLLYDDAFSFPSNCGDLPVPDPGKVLLIPSADDTVRVSPGSITAQAGKLSMDAVSAGVDACLSGQADALITAPISKEAISMAGFRVPGHTEFLAERTGAKAVGMMLVNEAMRVGLVTIHIPLRKVPEEIGAGLILARLRLYREALKNDFGIPRPRIAVLALNPHAGDGGVLGTEELDIITPVLEEMRREGMDVTGPWPADGFFGSGGHKNVDMVLAMYHDQGLIPLKLAGFGGGVNVTAGLPIIRTSPDHGTAFSLAGKNRADQGSMLAAVTLALDMIRRRTSAS